MEITKQSHLLEILLSSGDVFSSCVGIIKSEYFDGELRKAVSFALNYFEKYNKPPKIETLISEFPDVDIAYQNVTTDQVNYACEEIERYCRESATVIAINESLKDLEEGNLGEIVDRLRDAVSVSIKRDLGWSFYDSDFLEKLEQALAQQETIPTGIKALDVNLGGGLSRKQVTLFTANSGGCKSVMLNNLAHNYSRTGHHVVLLSLELPKEMVFVRSSSIISGYDIKNLGETKTEVGNVVQKLSNEMEGSLFIQRIRGDSTPNDVRGFLTHYELELGRKPDVLLLDYLDKMTPNQGVGRLSISEQDKFKSEQLAEVAFDYNCICASASQQNRDAIGNLSPGQGVIAGGITKINTVDNVISLYMDDEMRVRGEMAAFFLKTRSSDGVGKRAELFFDTSNLRITDPDSASNSGIFDLTSRRDDIRRKLPGLNIPELSEKEEKFSNVLNFDSDKVDKTEDNALESTEQKKITKPPAQSDELLNFMETLED